MPVNQRPVQRVLIDDRGTRQVQYIRSGWHQPDLLGADESPGVGGLGTVHRHDLRTPQEIIQGDRLAVMGRKDFGRNVRIVGHHWRAEALESLRHGAPGEYMVKVHYFSGDKPTKVDVKATFTKGSPEERTETHTVELKRENQEVEVFRFNL
jgi:hypothetical protein